MDIWRGLIDVISQQKHPSETWNKPTEEIHHMGIGAIYFIAFLALDLPSIDNFKAADCVSSCRETCT